MPGLVLGFTIKPIINSKICIGIGPYTNNENIKDNSFYIDIFGESKLSIDFTFGIYIPSQYSPVSLSINFGIKGILGSGKIGMRLNLYFSREKKKMYSQIFYHKIEEYKFNYYVYFIFQINLFLFKICLRIRIYDKEFYSLLLYYYGTTRYYLYGKNTEIKDLCTEEISTIKNSMLTNIINKCYK